MGSTVVGKKPAKVVTRLGRRGRRGDDADDGAGGSRHTPLNAAFAIVQAYAIVAVATSCYGSVFGSPPPPEQSAVRALEYITRPPTRRPGRPRAWRRPNPKSRVFLSKSNALPTDRSHTCAHQPHPPSPQP